VSDLYLLDLYLLDLYLHGDVWLRNVWVRKVRNVRHFLRRKSRSVHGALVVRGVAYESVRELLVV
jgi:hypothetical protein